MQVSVLGTMRVTAGGEQVEIPGRRERTLLARLVADVGRMVPTSELVDALWPDDPPRTAAKTLQTVVLRVRNAVEPDRAGTPRLLVTDGPGYRLALDPSVVDAHRFLRMVELARESMAGGRPAAAASTLREALAMWRGPAYADFLTSSFGQAEARRLEQARLSATEDLCAAQIDADHADTAAAELERFVADHPHRERAWDLLMLAQYRLGRQAQSLETYERVRTLLADELGVDPGAALQRRQQQVLEQDPTLGGPEVTDAPPPWLREPPSSLHGRDEELGRLLRAWERVETGQQGYAVLRGPAGAGATRLAQALASHVTDRGGVVLDDGAAAEHDTLPHVSRPTLLVSRRPVDHPPASPTLVLRLARLDEDHLPVDATVVDLRPLRREDVAAMITDLVEPELVPEALTHVLERSGGWPGRVRAATVSWVREQAARSVRVASTRAMASATQLAEARSSLVDGVRTLTEAEDAQRHDGVCPWRGLAAYTVEDAGWFCGRERLTAELVARVAGSRVLAVVGPSGSGKSSVLRAGLLAALRDDLLPGSGRWRQVVVQPGSHPMRALAAAGVAQPGVAVADAIASLARAEDGPERVVLVVDQFEEAWTACQDEGERTAYLDTLASLPTGASGVTLVVAMRADLVGQLAEHQELGRVLGDSTVLVGQPGPEEIRRAVELPARRAGLRLDVGLADAVVSDAGREPGLLPLLSTSLTQLWHAREGDRLTLASYVATGGLSGAIAHQAEAAMDALGEDSVQLARTILLRLAGPGEGDLVTRRRVPLAELTGLGRPGISAVVEHLARARLLTVSDGFVEVSHEAVFREWPRLRDWLRDDATGRAVQRRLAVAASEWEDEDRDVSLLWSGTRLAAGLDVSRARPDEITLVERSFLDAAQAQLDSARHEAERRADEAVRRSRRLRLVATGLALVLVAAVAAGLLAWRAQAQAAQARTEAVAAQDEAERAAVDATAGRLAATAVNEDQHDRALLLAAEAVAQSPSPDTYGPLLTVVSRAPDLITQVRTEERFLRADASPDGATVFLGENAPTVWAVDARTGARRWRATVPVQPLGLAAGPSGLLVAGGSETGSGVALLDPGTGEQRWYVDEARLGEMLGADADPYARSVPQWTPDGRALYATMTHLVYLTTAGELDRAVALPDERWPDWFHLLPDGRVSMAVGDGEDYGSVVLDPEDPGREPERLAGFVWDSTADGRLLVVDDRDYEKVLFTVHDAGTLEPVGDPVPVRASRDGGLSADGTTLFAGEESDLAVIDMATGERLATHRAHAGTVMDLTVAADGEVLWTAGRDGAGMAWDLTGRLGAIGERRVPTGVAVGSASVETGIALAVSWDDHDDPGFGTLHVVDLPAGEVLVDVVDPPSGAERFVWATAVSADGRTGVTAWGTGDDPYVSPTVLTVHDLPSGAVRTEVELPGPVLGLDVVEDGSHAVVAGARERAVVDLVTGTVLARQESALLELAPDSAGLVALSPAGDRAAVGTPTGVAVVDSRTAEEVVAADLPWDDAPVSLSWSTDGRTVLVGSFGGRVHALDATTLVPRTPARIVSPGWVIDVAVSPAGDVAASLGTDGDLLLWDTVTWQPLGRPVSDETEWGWMGFDPERPVLHQWADSGTLVSVSVDLSSWVDTACRTANRELSEVERELYLRDRAGQPSAACTDGAR
ncbi:BTAD domain-containing putative transcriptional regulator [Ornithinimicrobium cerasi]|uniref:DNA-binding transcriptional activator of the SARP family n=1 Tax=Ornithinimicrobium cerasi TaxID=2248773 RepID=A0A285VLP4_9MICO|nr:BTAD domain-containing putative transcriptional regulator [Ornithinimicrobium cerasi]SOC53501.1 DNA-binding transcriptional activator of the SARP family [Ornithinimicrobium cerasi]